MKILFICLSTLEFNVRTPYEAPLGGTESALSYLSVELAKLGHDVFLMAKTQDNIIDGVQHLAISENIEHINPDVVIVTSAPQACPAIKKLVPRAKLILWNHMQPDQPAMLHLFQPEAKSAIDHLVYVSESQRSAFIKVDTKIERLRDHVIGNAMSPVFENMFTSSEEILAVKKCRGAYTSTPFRGLAILSHIKELPIEVYSSMAVYQGDDTSFEAMYENLKLNDCIELKGSVSQTQLREGLKEISFLVYPSIFTECHSIAILEAMAAGLKVITTEAASPETEFIDAMPLQDGSVETYTALLRRNVNSFRSRPEAWADKMFKQIQYVNSEFTWAKKAKEWDRYLQNITSMPTSL